MINFAFRPKIVLNSDLA